MFRLFCIFNRVFVLWFSGGVLSTLSWAYIWPFEVLKNQIQSGNAPGPQTIFRRFRWLTRTQGMLVMADSI